MFIKIYEVIQSLSIVLIAQHINQSLHQFTFSLIIPGIFQMTLLSAWLISTHVLSCVSGTDHSLLTVHLFCAIMTPIEKSHCICCTAQLLWAVSIASGIPLQRRIVIVSFIFVAPVHNTMPNTGLNIWEINVLNEVTSCQYRALQAGPGLQVNKTSLAAAFLSDSSEHRKSNTLPYQVIPSKMIMKTLWITEHTVHLHHCDFSHGPKYQAKIKFSV